MGWSQVFSRIFDKWRSPAREARAWRRHYEALRFQGHGGGRILTHRALIRLPLRRGQLWGSTVIAVGIAAIWFAAQPVVTEAWRVMLDIGHTSLGLEDPVLQSATHLSFYTFRIPYSGLADPAPSQTIWWVTVFITLALFFASFLIEFAYLPLTYILRSVVFIQASALVFFSLWPAAFPFALADYLYGMMLAGYVLIGLVPIVFGLTYYVFDFGIVKKLLLTAIVMLHLAVFIPLQYLLQGYLVHQLSFLFLPVMFFLFGLPVDILILIAFYGWGMSWEPRTTAANPALPPA